MAWCSVCNMEVEDLEAHNQEMHPEQAGESGEETAADETPETGEEGTEEGSF